MKLIVNFNYDQVCYIITNETCEKNSVVMSLYLTEEKDGNG